MSIIKNNKSESSEKGTLSNPYFEEEYQQLLAEGKDIACYVEGRGFCTPAAMAPPTTPGSSSDPSDPSEPEPSSEPSEPIDEWIFITCNISAGAFSMKPSTFPMNARIRVSWSSGTFQSVNPAFLPRLESVELAIEYNDEHYIYNTPLNIRTFDWTNNYDILVSGSLSYESDLSQTGLRLSVFNTLHVDFTETIRIPDEFREHIEE